MAFSSGRALVFIQMRTPHENSKVLPALVGEELINRLWCTVKGCGAGDMSTKVMESQLCIELNACQLMARRGCQARLVRGGGVALERHRRVIGVWRWHNGGFELSGTRSPHSIGKVETVAEAMLISRERLCPAA